MSGDAEMIAFCWRERRRLVGVLAWGRSLAAPAGGYPAAAAGGWRAAQIFGGSLHARGLPCDLQVVHDEVRTGGQVFDDAEMVAFCRREHPRIVGVLAFSLGDPWVAEELAQETIIRVCQNWPKVRDMAAPQAWVHRVALNLANSWLRRRVAERRATAKLQARPALPSDADGTDTIAVRAAIASLPERQRTALVLRYYADLPAADVARVMGCQESTVRALTYQAIRGLRDHAGLLDLQEITDAV